MSKSLHLYLIFRMSESLKLFETILEYPWFKKKSIILFLNKKDSFEKKFRLSPLSNYFHEYTGSPTDPEEVTLLTIINGIS